MLCQSLLFAAVLICIPTCRVFWSGSLTATKRSMQCTNLNVRHRHRKKTQQFPAQGNNPISTETVHTGRSKLDQHDVPFPSAHNCEKAPHACTTTTTQEGWLWECFLVAANTSDFLDFDASYTITRLTQDFILHELCTRNFGRHLK